MLAFVDARIVNVPQFRTLVLRIPLAEFVPERIDAFLGARFFLVPPRAAECGVIAPLRQAVEQGARLQKPAALLRADAERIGAFFNRLLVGVNDQFRPDRRRKLVAELDHFTKLIGRIYVQKGEGNAPRIEGLLRQPDHHGRVLADGIQHDGVLKFGRDFANYLNALSFEKIEMVHRFTDLRCMSLVSGYTINLIGIQENR